MTDFLSLILIISKNPNYQFAKMNTYRKLAKNNVKRSIFNSFCVQTDKTVKVIYIFNKKSLSWSKSDTRSIFMLSSLILTSSRTHKTIAWLSFHSFHYRWICNSHNSHYTHLYVSSGHCDLTNISSGVVALAIITLVRIADLKEHFSV